MNKVDPTNLTELNIQLDKLDSTLNPVTIHNIFVGSGVRKKLFDLLDLDRKVFLVMDDTKMLVGEKDLKKEIEDEFKKRKIDYEKLVFKHADSPDGMVHADWDTVEKLKKQIDEKKIVVSVGSGTITDIAKHATYMYSQEKKIKVPLIVLQTANTVTAFTSNIAVLLKDGVKRTYPSRYPNYVLSDIEILKNAPYKLTQAGFGDLLARYVSYADWYIGYKCKNLDKYTEVPKLLLDEMLDYLVKNADKIRKGDKNAYTILTKALLNAGISMSIVGMSTPISGFEHVISHVLDMMANVQNKKSTLHGAQVGIATLLVAYAYERLLFIDGKSIQNLLSFPKWEKVKNKMEENFASQGFSTETISEMLNDYKIKYDKWIEEENTIREFFKLWDMEKDVLKRLLKSGDEIKNALKGIGIKIDMPENMDFAFCNAHFIRKRFTSADLLFFINKLNSELYKSILERLSNG